MTADGQKILRRFQNAGFKKFEHLVKPTGWSDADSRDPSRVVLLAANISRLLNLSISQVLADGVLPTPSVEGARFFRPRGRETDGMGPAVHLARAVASAAVRALADPDREVCVPASALAWRTALLAEPRPRVPSLEALVDDLWERGVVVLPIPVLPAGKPFGMAMWIEERPVVVLSKNTDRLAEQAWTTAHEVAHIALGHCDGARVVVDVEEGEADDAELTANRWADEVLIGEETPILPTRRERSPKHTDPNVMAWVWARHGSQSRFREAAGKMSALGGDTGARQLLVKAAQRRLDLDNVGEADRRLLELVAEPG